MKSNLSIDQQFFPLLKENALVLLPTMTVIHASKQAQRFLQIDSTLLPTPLADLFPTYTNLKQEATAILSTLNPEKNNCSQIFNSSAQNTLQFDYHAIFSDSNELVYLIIEFGTRISSSDIINTKLHYPQLFKDDASFDDLQRILVNMLHLTMIYQANGLPLFFSEQIEEFTGLSQQELASRMYEYLIYPETRRETLDLFIENLQTGEAFVTEVLVRRKDGVYRWLEGAIQPLKNKKGKITHWVGSFTDIHERKENARLIRDQMKNLDSMTRFMPQILWILEPNGLPSFFNWRWYKYTGLSETESLSRNWVKMIHKNDQPLINDLFVFSYKDDENQGIELQIISKNNEYRWFLCQVIPVQNEEGDIIQWLGTFTDINEHKQIEQQKDEFINIASHELKTPLTSIKAYLEIAKNYVDEKNPLSIYINGARKGTERLSTLISSLLDVTHNNELVDSSRFEYFSLQIFLEDILETFRGAYPRRKIHLTGHTKVAIYGDPERLGQVLNNLLTNAVKYSAPDSSISVELQRKNINFMEILVKDYGMGMPQDELKNIFKRYYRIDSTRLVSGLGLGLYICRKIIEAHGGWIFAESKEGKGSRLIFTLPVSENVNV